MAQLNNQLFLLLPAHDNEKKSSVYIKTYDYTDDAEINRIIKQIEDVNSYIAYDPCQCFYYKANYDEFLEPLKVFSREKTHNYPNVVTKLKKSVQHWKCKSGTEDSVLFFIHTGQNVASAIIDNSALIDNNGFVADEENNRLQTVNPNPFDLWSFFKEYRDPTRVFHVITKHPVNVDERFSDGYRSTMRVTKDEAEAVCNSAIGGQGSSRDFYFYFKDKRLFIRYFKEGDIPQNTFHAYTFDEGNNKEMSKIPAAIIRYLKTWC